jgi:hypothetical protein
MGGRAGLLRRFEWSPPDGPTVTQLQVYCVENARGYTATATATTENFRSVEPVIVGVLDRLMLDDAPMAALHEGSLS